MLKLRYYTIFFMPIIQAIKPIFFKDKIETQCDQVFWNFHGQSLQFSSKISHQIHLSVKKSTSMQIWNLGILLSTAMLKLLVYLKI